jgi:predicted translin family RNA/ssDNA-binding protein
MLPARPTPFQRPNLLDLTAVADDVSHADEKRQKAYEASRKLHAAIVQARTALETDEDASKIAGDNLQQLFSTLVSPEADRNPRDANFASRLEDFVRLKAFSYFLQTGRLLPPSHCHFATDEEFLAGACMGFAADLARYGMGRATVRDADSVKMARNLVQDIMDQLLQFDFRNGPLRRKYDGTKYALKTLETLLYELSITGSSVEEEEPDCKRIRIEPLLPADELEALRKRMEHRDELRETLIKKCRDGQKAAKQSIFAMHRGDCNKATQLLTQCETCVTKDLLPIVQEEPPLRSGSFANVLEEYAEAKLFYAWLFGKADGNLLPTGEILAQNDFSIQLEPEEYLGGLCDLTGEVGRYAVQRGTARDTDGVKLCLQTNGSIQSALQTMGRLPGNTGKKMGALQQSVEKLERMLYEMSLSEATGGRNVATDSMQTERVDEE